MPKASEELVMKETDEKWFERVNHNPLNNIICCKCHSRLKAKSSQYCNACKAHYARENRSSYGELTSIQKKKANARSYANTYQRRGLIIPNPCEVCGKDAEKHHDDYDKPTEIKWLCREHHLDLHKD